MMNRDIAKGRKVRSEIDMQKVHDMIAAGYAADAREDKVRVKESFAPSSIGYGNATCPRYWYLAFEGKYKFVETTDPMGQANMDNGNSVHTRLENVFEKAGTLVSKNVEMKMVNPPVRGFIDALIRVDDEIVVFEFKSAKQEIFMHRLNTMKPAPYHLYQILLYLKATGKRNGVLLYENKNDQSILPIPVTMDEVNEKIINDALDWMSEVRENWETGKDGENLPTRPWTQKNKNCKGCPLFDECWNNLPDGTVTIKPMEVVTP